jgi:uncharacterized membrane protein YqiK
MSTLTKIAVALTAVVSCAAFAQTDSDADRARRERNMDEVLARHHVQLDQMGDTQAMNSEKPTLRERSHRVAETTREKTHKVAQSTRNFTHRQAEKMRDFGARQDAKYHTGSDRPAAKAAENTPS